MLKRNQWKNVFLGAVAGVVLLGAGGVSAEVAAVEGVKVIRTISNSGFHGDCLVQVSKVFSDIISGCTPHAGSKWVTLSCDGTYNSKDAGQRKFESAQLAMALGYRVSLWVDNTKKHNGYCFAKRIDVYK